MVPDARVHEADHGRVDGLDHLVGEPHRGGEGQALQHVIEGAEVLLPQHHALPLVREGGHEGGPVQPAGVLHGGKHEVLHKVGEGGQPDVGRVHGLRGHPSQGHGHLGVQEEARIAPGTVTTMRSSPRNSGVGSVSRVRTRR